jgi:branched-chain amino acid transport system substrate-binding protein
MRIRGIFLTMVTLVSIMILLGSIHSYAEEVRGVTKDTIRIAVITDMSGPAVQDYGPYREGVVNYLRYSNEQEGINGRKIKMSIEDDRYSIPVAIASFKKVLYRDGVLAIMGLGIPTITPPL